MAIVKYKFLENVTLKSFLSMAVVALFAFSVLLVLNPAVAAPNENASDKAIDVTKFVVPENAKEIAPGVFSLGTTVHNGKLVEGIMAFHHRNGHGGGPPGGNGGEVDGDSTITCYSTFTKGAKWRAEESWNVNTSGLPDNVSPNFVKTNLADDMTAWEESDGTTNYGIFGNIDETIVVDVADTISPDGKNEVLFGDIISEGSIAVTITWYETRGPPQSRDIVEWDQVYDVVDYDWSDGTPYEEDKMDFANIATHELGHALGLGHPDDSCTEETMYAFADFGDTNKITLESGDIAGVQQIYG